MFSTLRSALAFCLLVLGSQMVPATVHAVDYFTDSFANNSAGWTFDTGWSIGSATASSGHSSLGPDPASDNTVTSDNGIAGYAIGGNTGTSLFPARYITSPVINTQVSGSVFLEFYRWLNSDYPNYMSSTVEVWNGTAWVQVFLATSSPTIQDTAWTKVQYDVTAHKNADFRVRFSVAVTGSGVWNVSSWNIDDLRVHSGVATAPDIVVEEPAGEGNAIADGGSRAFGTVNVGGSAAKTFTIKNTGTADLTLGALSKDGTDSDDFTIGTTGMLTTVTPGNSTTFTVTFAPGAGGARNAVLHIASNAAGAKNPYDITFTAMGNTPPQLSLPGSPLMEIATSLGGATVNFTVSATDGEDDPDPVPVANPPSGSTFLIGRTQVNVSATDTAGVITNGSFIVTVTPGALDTAPPVVKLTAPTASSVGRTFNIAGTVRDNYGLNFLKVKLNGVEQTLDQPLDKPLDFAANTNVPWSVTGAVPENGSNFIEVEAADLNGRTTRVTKAVTYWNRRTALAGTYHALLVSAGIPDVNTSGLVTLTVLETGAFSGKAMLGGVEIPFLGVLRNDGVAQLRGTSAMTTELPLTSLVRTLVKVNGRTTVQTVTRNHGTLSLAVSNAAELSGALKDGPGEEADPLAWFDGPKAPYHRTNLVPAQFLNLPITGTATRAYYTVGFVSNAEVETPSHPKGDGYVSLTMTNTGTATLFGFLADGTPCTASGQLRADGSMAIFTPLYGKLGGLAGELAFAALADSDVAGSEFLWIRPAQPAAPQYAEGWPNGVLIDAVGAKYATPASLNFGQGPADTLIGNANLVFTDGLLSAALTYPVSVNPLNGVVAKIPATNPNYTLVLTPGSGVMAGTFKHTDGSRVTYRGVLINKGANQGAFGHFLSNGPGGEGGGVSLDPSGPTLSEE